MLKNDKELQNRWQKDDFYQKSFGLSVILKKSKILILFKKSQLI